MDPSADIKPARLTRSLLGRSRQGALATLTPGSGDPYCSLVNVASLPDGAPILLRRCFLAANVLGDGAAVEAEDAVAVGANGGAEEGFGGRTATGNGEEALDAVRHEAGAPNGDRTTAVRPIQPGGSAGTKTPEQVAADVRRRWPVPIDSGPLAVDILRRERDAR